MFLFMLTNVAIITLCFINTNIYKPSIPIAYLIVHTYIETENSFTKRGLPNIFH